MIGNVNTTDLIAFVMRVVLMIVILIVLIALSETFGFEGMVTGVLAAVIAELVIDSHDE